MFPRAIKTNKLPPYLRGNGLKQKYFAQLFTIEMYLHILPRCELFIISPIYGKFHNCISIYLKTYFFILRGDFFIILLISPIFELISGGKNDNQSSQKIVYFMAE